MWMNPMSPAVAALSIDAAEADTPAGRPPMALPGNDAGAIQQATITFASPAAGVADGDDSKAAATPR
jgi:hypothetical protein